MSKQSWAVASIMIGLFSALTFISAVPSRAWPQDFAQPPASVDRLDQGALHQGVTFKIDGPTQRLEMVVATSRILTLEHKIPKLLVNNTDIVRAAPISPNQIQLSALSPGVTQLNVWDDRNQLHTVDVVVTPDARQLEMLLKSEFPDATIRVRPLANSVYISGYVPSPDSVRSIVKIAEDYYPSVINNLQISGVQEIQLKAKVMEVSRTKLREVGFDWALLSGSDFVTQSVSGLIAPGSAPAAFAATGGDLVRFGIVDGNTSFFAFIDALRQNDLIKVMAEPTLVTVSGRPASFQSGGEFPIVVPQSLGTVSIEYREYGTRIDFVPIVLGNGNLRLEVRPQVSEIDPSRSVMIRDINVPALRTRWVDTAVEMKAGQTLALAGLIQTRVEAQNRGLPWLSDIPWFGAPFRRVNETTNEVELLILVTPEFVDAVDPEQLPPCGPGETTTSPNDVELYWRGYLEVPKCCPDGSCQSCQGEVSGLIGPSEAQFPHEVLPSEGQVLDSAARHAPRDLRQASNRPSGPVRATVGSGSSSKKPVLIGPVGYDTLK